jgi:hypothetical protein
VGGREDHLDEVGFLGGYGGASEPRDPCCPLGEPAAGSADHEMRIDRFPFHFAVLTVQPGREELLTLGAIHITMVAYRVPRVPEVAGVTEHSGADLTQWGRSAGCPAHVFRGRFGPAEPARYAVDAG